MLQWEYSALLSAFIKLPFVIKTFVLSIFEWPFYTGFTVFRNKQKMKINRKSSMDNILLTLDNRNSDKSKSQLKLKILSFSYFLKKYTVKHHKFEHFHHLHPYSNKLGTHWIQIRGPMDDLLNICL